MFFIEKEDKLLNKDFCYSFTQKIIKKFNLPKYKDVIDPQFLTYISKPGAIQLLKTLNYSIEGIYKCEVTFDVKLEENYVVSDGYEAKTTGEGRTEYTTGRLKIDATTTYTEKKHLETKKRYSQCVKTYFKHFLLDEKGGFRNSSSSEFSDVDPDYRRKILEEISDHESLYSSLENYSKEEKEVKKEYDQKVASNVQVSVQAKKVKITSPDIEKVDVYASYNYYASIYYNGKEYIYHEYDDPNEDFPLNLNATKIVKASKKVYSFQKMLAWIMGIPTFIALAAILIVAIFVRFKGNEQFLTYITFPFTIIDAVVAIIYFVLFNSFISTLDDIILSSSGSHMLNRKRNKNKTAMIEIFYYLVAIGSLILAIFQLICVVEAFKIASSYA
ncbi:unknown [Firmicutes bacterium CAG:631]|nr:unknown [Firmicutes bacterium CAG:631]